MIAAEHSNTGVTVGANQNACSNLGPVSINGGATFAAQSLNYNNFAVADSVVLSWRTGISLSIVVSVRKYDGHRLHDLWNAGSA